MHVSYHVEEFDNTALTTITKMKEAAWNGSVSFNVFLNKK